MLLNPFCPNLAGDLYKNLRKNTGKAFHKDNLSEYSLLKLQETSDFFKEMIRNPVIMNIIVDGKSQGNVIFSKASLDNKVLMVQIIKDTILIDNEIFDKHYEIDIQEGEVKITTGID